MSRSTPVSMPRLALGLAVAMIASLAAAPGVAGASMLTSSFAGSLEFQADPGVANQVTATAEPGAVTITDPADTITTAVPGCSGSGTNKIECAPPVGSDFTQLRLTLDNFAGDSKNDTAAVSGSIAASASGGGGNDLLSRNGLGRFEGNGGAGDDVINGGAGTDSLIGDSGVDLINGAGGHDAVQGGEGDGDVVRGEAGNDLIIGATSDGSGDSQDGGPGLDELLYLSFELEGTPTSYTVDLGAGFIRAGAETDSLVSVENSITFQGSDSVFGSAGSNKIVTATDEETLLAVLGGLGSGLPADGGDTVDPRGGPDFVKTGAGTDIVNLVDGTADLLDCGSGTDIVEADQFDELIDCENVTTVTPVASAAPDTVAPKCDLKGIAGSYQRKAFLRGLRPSVSCDESVTLEAELVTVASAKKKKAAKGKRTGRSATVSRAGDLVLAEAGNAGVAAATFSLRPTGPGRALLGPSFSASLRIVARDKAGNATVLQRAIRVKPDRKKGKSEKGKKKG